MSSRAIDRLLAIEFRLDALWMIQNDAIKERDSLRREKSSILMGLSWAERKQFDEALLSRVARPLDAISATRAKS